MMLPNWRQVLARAQSLRWIAAAGFLTALETALSVLANDPPVPPQTLAIASFLCTGMAFYARLRAQGNLSGGGEL